MKVAGTSRKLLGAASLGLLGSLASPVAAGDWHLTETLICSDCHTIHNSEQGQPMRYDGVLLPAPILLRAQDSTQLCLSCHDGSRPDAPDVVAPVSTAADPAGGWFPEDPVGRVNPQGHDLLTPSPTPAPGGQDSLVLTCVSCHTPHGNSNYRNLLYEPPGSANDGPAEVVVVQLAGGSRTGPSIVIEPDGLQFPRGLPRGGSNPDAAYAPENLRYKSGVAQWCNDCHSDFHGTTAQEEGGDEPWLRHPQDRMISGSYGADFAHWSQPLPARVPVETPTDDLVPSADDRVFCLSCHKAHGSSRAAGLIYADGSSRLSTCQQCHNQ